MQVVARLPLGLGEGQHQLAGGDLRHQLRPQLGDGAVAQEAAADDDGRDPGLQRDRLAELLGDQHRLDMAAAEAALILGEGQAEQAELGILRPDLACSSPRATS